MTDEQRLISLRKLLRLAAVDFADAEGSLTTAVKAAALYQRAEEYGSLRLMQKTKEAFDAAEQANEIRIPPPPRCVVTGCMALAVSGKFVCEPHYELSFLVPPVLPNPPGRQVCECGGQSVDSGGGHYQCSAPRFPGRVFRHVRPGDGVCGNKKFDRESFSDFVPCQCGVQLVHAGQGSSQAAGHRRACYGKCA
jgi:hypothetical protein